MNEDEKMDPILLMYGISLAIELVAKLLQTGQAQTITMDQVLAKAAENQAAHDELQNQP